MRLVAHAVLGISAVLLIASGCGGKQLGGGGSAGSGGSGGSSGGADGGTGGTGGCGGGINCPVDGGLPPVESCPASPPSQGDPCENIGLWCEYGSSPDPYCNGLWPCGPPGTWQPKG